MAAALKVLGINTYHSLLMFSSRHGDIEMWLEAIDAKFFGIGHRYGRAEWDQLLHDFGGVSSDTPMIAFSQDLVEAYPEAKVILTYRDIDAWYESYDKNIIAASTSWVYNAPSLFMPFLRRIREVHRRAVEGWLGMQYDKESMRSRARKAYTDHYANVRRITPPERLLEFQLQDGWEPLCKFLDKPIPNQPFPMVNDTADLEEKIGLLLTRAAKYYASKALFWLIAAILIAFVWRYCSHILVGSD